MCWSLHRPNREKIQMFLKPFVTSAIFSSAVSASALSFATTYNEIFPATMCQCWPGNDTDCTAILLSSGGSLGNGTQTRSNTVWCPLPSNGSAISNLYVWGTDNGNGTSFGQ